MRALQQAGGEGLNLQNKAGKQRYCYLFVLFQLSNKIIHANARSTLAVLTTTRQR